MTATVTAAGFSHASHGGSERIYADVQHPLQLASALGRLTLQADGLPDAVVWAPLIGSPIVRRTWVVWPANSRRRDLAQLVASFDVPGDA